MAFSKGKRGKKQIFTNTRLLKKKDVTFSIGFITDLYYICNVKIPNTKKRMIWREVN